MIGLRHAKLIDPLPQDLHRLLGRVALVLRLVNWLVSISTRNDVPPWRSRPSRIPPQHCAGSG